MKTTTVALTQQEAKLVLGAMEQLVGAGLRPGDTEARIEEVEIIDRVWNKLLDVLDDADFGEATRS